ncbi:MAG: amylo-alpha-1,6-glucosidase [Nodosilinea sp.]
MTITLGRDLCGHWQPATRREWLVTNGIGGYSCGTVAGILTRHYHGLLVAALKPPLGRTLLVTKADETMTYLGQSYDLHSNRWADGSLHPQGYAYLESFRLDGTIPVWVYAIGDALVEKRIWMEPGANTTYSRYTVTRASASLDLVLKVLVNYRDHHHSTQAEGWQMQIVPWASGAEAAGASPKGHWSLQITASETAQPFYLYCETGTLVPAHTWYRGYALAMEAERGIHPDDDHLHAATVTTILGVGQSFTLVASTEAKADRSGHSALLRRQAYEHHLIQQWQAMPGNEPSPAWHQQLVLAADQFVVNRSAQGEAGKTILAGYPWFGDWGRDTMIALPGLTLATGRAAVAKPILQTFADYLDQGMLPNLFPETGEPPHYNTVDATLWYVEAVRAYHQVTADTALLAALFPALQDIITWHHKGTRYNIHVDPADGLLYAGEPGVQLTWMDAKVGDWVVTPRLGKPVEVNALWYNALLTLGHFARILGQPDELYMTLAAKTRQGLQRFWDDSLGHCYDVLDGPDGNDAALRPNQIFAVMLPQPELGPPCLSPEQQKAVVDRVAQQLVTSHGLRSLAPSHPQYQGRYGGDPVQRDGAYHQGTVWAWLLGSFVQAHWQVYQDADLAYSFLAPLAEHLRTAGLGTISEIFDGDAPMAPRGAFAQAWSVAEVLRVSTLLRPFLKN